MSTEWVRGLESTGQGPQAPLMAFGICKKPMTSYTVDLRHDRISDLRDQSLWGCALVSVHTFHVRPPLLLPPLQRRTYAGVHRR